MTAERLAVVSVRGRAAGQLALVLPVLGVPGWRVRRHRPVLEAGALPLAVAGVAAAATWGCSALAQQGAALRPLPARRPVAALPKGSGPREGRPAFRRFLRGPQHR